MNEPAIQHQYCANCGAQHPTNSNFCEQCGSQLKNKHHEAPQTAKPAASQPQPQPQNQNDTHYAFTIIVFGLVGFVGVWIPLVGFIFAISGITLAVKAKDTTTVIIPILSMIASIIAWIYWAGVQNGTF